MKNKLKIINSAILFSIIVIVLNGCAGKDGAPGASGPAGNANVQNYDITVSSWQWTYDNLYQRFYYRYASLANSNSAVYGYVMSGSGKQAMPYRTSTSSWSEQFDLACALFNTTPYIEFQYTNYNSRTTKPSSDVNFYLVIIPPSAKLTYPNLDWSNYEEVKRVFKLDDPIKLKRDEILN